MYVRIVPVTRLAAGIVDLLYSQIRHLSLHRRNVYGSRISGSESVPVRSQGKHSSWHVQPRLAERGEAITPFSPAGLSACQCVPYHIIILGSNLALFGILPLFRPNQHR